MQDNAAWSFTTATMPSQDDVAVHEQPTLVMPQVQPELRPGRQLRPRWRTIARNTLIVCSVLLVLLVGSGIFFWLNPPALGTAMSPLLPAQAGAVPWNGTDTINILAMGVDQRPGQTSANSDTMIVVTLDPTHKHVRMLSIPRDLAVSVPGFGDKSKINAGYAEGSASDTVQGGPKYAAFTVEQALGIPINYYAVVNFDGFRKLIDAMGGVDITVDQNINDQAYPAEQGYGFSPFVISAGPHHMDGATALRYMRERHAYPTQEDQARVRHQQQLLTAMKGRIFSLRTLLNLPNIISALRNAITSNLPDNLLPTVSLMLFQDKNVEHIYLNEQNGLVQSCEGLDQGADLCPVQPQFDTQISALFAAQHGQIAAEHAAVLVQNGTPEADETHHVVKLLRACNFTVIGGENADNNHHAHNAVIVNTARPDAPYTTRLLQQMFGARLIRQSMPNQQAQDILIVGKDTPQIPYLWFQQN